MTGPVEKLNWSDELDVEWSKRAAEALKARPIYSGYSVCEIVLEGKCPRCAHPMVSTHPVRGVTPPEARERRNSDSTGRHQRLLVLRCRCSHTHEGCPSDMDGCGVPFAVWVQWADATERDTPASQVVGLESGPKPSLMALEQECSLQAAKATELVDVRKAAENWRTGLGALLAILVAVLFLEGKQSLDEIGPLGVQILIAALLLMSAAFALYGAYRAVRAANGIPSDEFTGNEDSKLMKVADAAKSKLLPEAWLRTPSDPTKYETVGAWRHAFVQLAVDDLRHAKLATVGSLALFAVAVMITWIAAGPSK